MGLKQLNVIEHNIKLELLRNSGINNGDGTDKSFTADKSMKYKTY